MKFYKYLLPALLILALVAASWFWRMQRSSTHAVSPTQSAQETPSKIPEAKHGQTLTQNKAPSATAPSCYTLRFKHQSLPTHSGDDECSHHRNLIKLGRADINPTSICIRVNGIPVRHEATSAPDEFIIGAVAGPNDRITARFCLGKSKCDEGCPYPKKPLVKKDEFLEAIGGDADSEGDLTLAQWESGDMEKSREVSRALEGEIKTELEDREIQAKSRAANNASLALFKDWIRESESVSCDGSGRAVASVPAKSRL